MDATRRSLSLPRTPHHKEVYQRYRTGAVCWLERVLRQIGIRQAHVHLSVKPQDLHSHHCFAALLVVEADPVVPFAEEVITATSTDEALSVQIAAHKMTTKRLLAQF